MEDLKGWLIKFYGFWILADTLLFIFSILLSFLAGGLGEALEGLFTSFAVGLILFPFSLLVAWQRNLLGVPYFLGVLIQLTLSILLLVFNESRK